MDTTSKPGIASKHYVDSATLANAGSGGSADSTKFATLYRMDTVKANRVTLWKYATDTLNARYYSDGLYQAKGTYLIASDTTGKWTLINTKLDKSVYYSDTTNARTYSNNLYQLKGTYLIPSDTTNIRSYTNAQLNLKLNHADTSNRWVQVGKYYSDTTNGRTYSDNRYQPKMPNGTSGYVWKMTSETTQGWSADISGGGGIDTTSLSNRIDAKIPYSDTTSSLARQWRLGAYALVAHNQATSTITGFGDSLQQVRTLANSKQAAGTYLVPNDTNNVRTYTNSQLALKLNKTDTMTLSVRIDKKTDTASVVMPWELGAYKTISSFATDTSNQRTFTNSQLALKLPYSDTTSSLARQWRLGAYKTISSFATDTSNQRTYTNNQLALKLNYADTSGRWTHVTKYGVDTTGQRTYTTNLLALKLPYSDTTSSLARQWRLGAYKTISSFATDTSNQRTYTNSQLALKFNQADTSTIIHWVDTNKVATKAYVLANAGSVDTTNTIATKAYVNGKTDTVSTIAKKNTATPGSYTNSNITIALDGRITAISNGSAGSGGGSYSPWTYYGFTRISDTLVSVAHNVDFKAGKPIRFRDVDSVYRYALITQIKTGVSYDTLIISGPSFYSVADSLWLGPAEKVVKTDFGMTEYWSNYPTSGGLFDSLIYLHAGAEFKWGNSDAYLVQFAAVTRVIDVTAGTKLNVWKGAETLIGYKGLNMTSGNGTWMYSSAYYINPINYKVSYGNSIDLRIEIADTTPDARHLTVSMWFILE